MPLVSKNFSDIITFTRASTATYFNSSGTLTSAAINEARFDYNPSTLAAQGLLIEEPRSNTAIYSQVFTDAAYLGGPADVTVTDNAATSPDGTTNAATFVEGTASAVHARFQRVSGLTANGTYTVSLFVKKNSGGRGFAFGFGSNTTGNAGLNTTNRGFARWDTLAAGAATATTANGTGSITSTNAIDVGNGWFRLTMTFVFDTGNTSTSFAFGFGITNAGLAAATTGDGSSYSIYGFQLEAGAFPTSYIPTTTTALTRSADVASVNTLSPWFNATEGTLYAQFDNAASGTRTIAAINDGTSNESIRLRSIGTNPYLTVTDGGVDQADIDAGTIAANTSYKLAGAYKANDFAACISAGTVQTDTSGTLPTVTQMMLGTSAAANYLNGHLRRVTYYPRRLSDAELQAITA